MGQDDGELVPSAELLTLATELGGVSGDSAETKQHKKRDLRRWDAANIKLPREFSLLPLPSCKRRIVQHEGTALRGCNLRFGCFFGKCPPCGRYKFKFYLKDPLIKVQKCRFQVII